MLAGCASRPINEPIATVDPRAGYRPHLLIPKRQNNDPHTLFVLSFSGGGTRAAAFSYGVLEEPRRTGVVVDGQRRQLLVAEKRIADATETQAEASEPKVTLDETDVNIDAIPDPAERAYFMNLPTSFVLPNEDIDRLVEVAGQLMRQSAEYELFVHDMGGNPAP